VDRASDRPARVWDISRTRGIGEPFNRHNDWVDSIAVSPDGTFMATGDADGKLRIWDVSTGRLVRCP
ncbi:hypothetical protein M405DRAFT_703967, partial [Rhizopogon salebrosus TDB-379]